MKSKSALLEEILSLNRKLDQANIDRVSLLREVEFLRKRNEEVEAEKKDLYSNFVKLSEALVAKESPTAFSLQKMDEMEARKTPEEREAERRRIEEYNVGKEYIREVEEPLFKDADDMIAMLARGMGGPISPPIQEGNEES